MNYSAHRTNSPNHAVSWPFLPSDFNGKEKDYESGFHYYGARYYWSEVLTGWLSVDPMMDKYPSISPYAYCAWTRPTGGDEHRLIKSNLVNNPVKLGDPDGRDWYDVYQDGTVKKSTNPSLDNNDGFDHFVMVKQSGTPIKGIDPLMLAHDNSFSVTNFDQYTQIAISGDAKGSTLFLYLATNTIIEWSQIKTGNDENGINYIINSHDLHSDNGAFECFKAIREKTILRDFTHSHPGGLAFPSGLTNDKKGKGDILFAKKITDWCLENEKGIPTFHIYSNGVINSYSATSRPDDYKDYLDAMGYEFSNGRLLNK